MGGDDWVWPEVLPTSEFPWKDCIDIVNNTDTLSGRMLVLVRQQIAVRTWRTVGEVSALGTVCVLKLKEQERVAGI